MPRKRARRKSPEVQVEKKVEPPIRKKIHKNWLTACSLIAIFVLVLFLNTYFNATSEVAINPNGEPFQEKFYLSGPDPYYNMRTITQVLETGEYPYGVADPLMNYPLGLSNKGGGARPPLFNMLTIGLSKIFSLGMSEMDAIGYAMQFIPALFGALLVFPVYFTGKALFNKHVGLISSLFVALIPVHLGSGHGSAFALFDHDSFNLFLFTMIYLFFIYALKEKNSKKSMIYSGISGLFLGALSLTWVEARFAYAVIMVYIIVQVIVNLFRNKHDLHIIRIGLISLLVGNVISIPLYIAQYIGKGSFNISLSLFLLGGMVTLSCIYYVIKKVHIPWIISIPSFVVLGGISYSIIYVLRDAGIPAIRKIYSVLAGVGIYGNKVSLTIAEAKTYGISRTFMSFGPSLYFIAFIGFALLCYYWWKNKDKMHYLFFAVLFLIEIWLLSTAGRFINDLVPLIAILSAWVTFIVIDKLNYKEMIKNIKSIGGLRGFRKGVKIYHMFGILFVLFLIILPNSYMAFYSGVPSGTKQKQELFGDNAEGVFGLNTYKETYWIDALMWLNKQDLEIENATDRPAFISWWDYGFYEVAVGKHPTVADNFQHGIPCAANFHTAKSEYEAISVLIIRCIHGDAMAHAGVISNDTRTIIQSYLPSHNETITHDDNTTENITYYPADDLIKVIENPEEAQSYGKVIAPEYGNKNYKVGEQRPENAMYHDGTKIITQNVSQNNIINMYEDIQNITGYSIRYYGVEGYDMQIFNVFSFLADKGTYGYITGEDDYYAIVYEDKNGKQYSVDEVSNLTQNQIKILGPFSDRTIKKDAYYESMVYQTYKGLKDYDGMPTYGMKHFVPKFISQYPYTSQYPAVIIAKYYPGCFLKGTVTVDEEPYPLSTVYVLDEYGIPHDAQYVGYNGEFSLIAPAGNLTLAVQMGNSLVSSTYKINITENEANRIENFTKEGIHITIEKGNISGYIHNATADTVKLGTYETNVSENGHYEFNNIIPNSYNLSVFYEDVLLHYENVFVEPKFQTYNVTVMYELENATDNLI
ncbi:MAG: STT3 domain-containing protein [Atribacterota bacterium]